MRDNVMHNVSKILNEEPTGFAQLAKRFRSSRRDGNLTPQAIWRWFRFGVRAADGRRVYLEAILVAGRYLSSSAAIERFIAAQQPQPTVDRLPVVSPSARERDARECEAELDRLGI